jgi:hypothetical protein
VAGAVATVATAGLATGVSAAIAASVTVAPAVGVVSGGIADIALTDDKLPNPFTGHPAGFPAERAGASSWTPTPNDRSPPTPSPTPTPAPTPSPCHLVWHFGRRINVC